MSTCTVHLDGIDTVVATSATILDVCRQRHIALPGLCARLPRMHGCDLCVAELSGVAVSACRTRIFPAAQIVTRSERLTQLRRTLLQLQLSALPAGTAAVSPWSELLDELGATPPQARIRPHQPALRHPLLRFDPARCTHCFACVDACDEASHHVLAPQGRGLELRLSARQAHDLLGGGCVTCLECVRTCPTQAFSAPDLLWLTRVAEAPASTGSTGEGQLRIQFAESTAPASTLYAALSPAAANALQISFGQMVELAAERLTLRASAVISALIADGAILLSSRPAAWPEHVERVRLRALTAAELALPADNSFELRAVGGIAEEPTE